jgi:phosphatidylserine/phosphatidylglycerophosphate/cardiolipin synthase-like enzyme
MAITATLEGLSDLIDNNAALLKQPGVIAVRPGYVADADGWPTTQRAILVLKLRGALDPAVPHQVAGVPVQVREAHPFESFAAQQPQAAAQLARTRAEARLDAFAPELAVPTEDAQLLAAKPRLPYQPPPEVALAPVSGALTFTVHASPDAGWPQLRTFLAATRHELVVGMYDFTSKHILDAVDATLAGGKKLVITLDNPAPNPSRDQLDVETLRTLRNDLGDDMTASWALNRMNRDISLWVYPSAYHIKVAVRDEEVVWLSSGNWNNSNQPDFDPIGSPSDDDQQTARKSDRDWHVIIENRDIAAQFRAYLLKDSEVALKAVQDGNAAAVSGATPQPAVPDVFGRPSAQFTFHKPVRIEGEQATITPLLTPDPDVYRKAMLDRIKAVEKSLYIQLQYIHPSNNSPADDAFTGLIEAVKEKIDDGKDVRIILSEWQIPGGWLDRLQDAGISLDRVKIQQGVHNKGFVFDHTVVALGSQNWSGDGVLRNRDASVIIENTQAAVYFEEIFLHDWDHVAQRRT